MSIKSDNRQVVLLKSERTGNRFYTLVDSDSDLHNAGTIESFSADLPLGIAYPCLEDGLNDFAVIRTTFETIEMVGDDPELRAEMMDMVRDARAKLILRLQELRDRLASRQAQFLGSDLDEFKQTVLTMVHKGAIRRTLDNMMKLDVFASVARQEAAINGGAENPMYHYRLEPEKSLARMEKLPPREFISELFDDLLSAVTNDEHYLGRHSFDGHIFQKFIALMFVNYATTDPQFYGTNRADYGVSADKDMVNTPLYQAVGAALREFEREYAPGALEAEFEEDLSRLFDETPSPLDAALPSEPQVEVVAEYAFIESLSKIGQGLRLLRQLEHPEALQSARIIHEAARLLFRQLQEGGLVSPLAADPFEGHDDD